SVLVLVDRYFQSHSIQTVVLAMDIPFTQFTTFCGAPFKKARIFSTAIFISRERAARVAHARCGVMRQFLAVSSGFSAEGGSADKTSSPAPAILPEFNASASACSSPN